jgi:SPP1 family predicted phage head-tail adaptor
MVASVTPTNQAGYAGDLRFRMRFDKQTVDNVDGGGSLSAWTEQFTRWADVRPMRGGEGVVQQRLTGKQPVLIVIRYDDLTQMIDTAWRAVELRDGVPIHYYDLKSVADMERQRLYITMLAVEGDAQS